MPGHVEFDGRTARLILSGDLDFSSQALIQAAAEEALANPAAAEIIVDLKKVTFMDSSTIQVFINLQKKAKAAGRPLTFINCSEKVRQIFVIGGFDQIFDIR